MTIIAARGDRRSPIVTQVYTVPVVRELPFQPPDEPAYDARRDRSGRSTRRGRTAQADRGPAA
jgi:hypothetical protein